MNFLRDGVDVVLKPDKFDSILVDDGVSGARVPVAGLSDGADVNDGLFTGFDFIDVFEFCGGVEVGIFGKDALHMGVSHEADVFHAFEDLLHFGR